MLSVSSDGFDQFKKREIYQQDYTSANWKIWYSSLTTTWWSLTLLPHPITTARIDYRAVCRGSSGGRAMDWKSMCRQFESAPRHHFIYLIFSTYQCSVGCAITIGVNTFGYKCPVLLLSLRFDRSLTCLPDGQQRIADTTNKYRRNRSNIRIRFSV